MNSKPTFVLLVIVAAMIAFFYLYENKQPGTRDQESDSKRLFALNRDEVQSMTITNHDLKIDLQQESPNHWRVKSPIADRADSALIDEVLTDLEGEHKEDTITVDANDKARLQEYGLQSPHVRLVVTPKGGVKPADIIFGNDTAIDGKTYVRLEGTNLVYVTSSDLKKVLEKDVNAWRDHRITDLTATDVNRLTVKNASGEIEVQRDGEHWKIVKPIAARGDDSKINDLVSQAVNLKVVNFVGDDKADAASYGLAEPRGLVTLYTAANTKGTELMLGSPVPAPSAAGSPSPSPSPAAAPSPAPASDAIYARLPARQSIYTVPNSADNFLTLKPNDLRDHALARINLDTVDRIHIAAGGTPPFTLARKDKAWTVNGGPANSTAVSTLVGAINNAQVSDFVADSAAPADLAKYGLDKPALQVQFAAFASENTAESSAGEKPVATVDFGKDDGTKIFAHIAEEPFIVSVPKLTTDSILTDPSEWQPLEIFKGDPQKITSLELAPKGGTAVAFTREDKDGWKATAGPAPDAIKVESMLNTLAHLRAVRWIGPALPTYALDNPLLTITFASATDPQTSAGKLYLGAQSPEAQIYARVEGKPGAFLISRPDYETLIRLAALPGAEPSPAPAAATPAGFGLQLPVPVKPPAAVPLPTAVH